MQTQIIQIDNNLVLFLKGRLMLNQCRQLKETVITRLNPTIKNIYIHLKAVDFIDSAGLGLLVGIKMSANKVNAQTYLIAPKSEVKTLFAVAKLDMIFKIIDSEDLVPDKELLKKARAKLENDTAVFGGKESAEITEITHKDGNSITNDPKHPIQDNNPSNEDRKEWKKEIVLKCCREALSYLNEGKLYKAVQNFKNALRHDPTYLPARNNLALLYEKKSQWYEQALEEWETLLTVARELDETKYIERAEKHIEKLRKVLNQ